MNSLKNTLRNIAAIVILSVISALANSSAILIQGSVTANDEYNTALEGVNVTLKTANLSTKTDITGWHSINFGPSDTTQSTHLFFNSASTLDKQASFFSPKLMTKEAKLQVSVTDKGATLNPMFFKVRNYDLQGRLLAVNHKNFQENTNSNPLLYKTNSTFYDTLFFEKDGYIPQSIPISDFESIINTSLDTVPVAAFGKRGAGSSSQTVAQGSDIVSFSFVYENAQNVIIEGLPQGISAIVDTTAKSIYFSGTIRDSIGTYPYTLTSVGGYTTAIRKGTFTVIPSTQTSTAYACIPDGYAMVNGKTTGGEGGDTVIVSNYAAFKSAVQAKEAKVVVVKGTIRTTDGDGYGLKIAANKTIMGIDSSATIYGGLSISGVSNVIVYNLNINGTYPNPGPSDAISINKSDHVFIHHLNIWNAEDGNLDITNQSSYITVSYVKFWYTDKNHPHRLNSLIGSGASNHPEDFGKLKVTFHHNWFSNLVDQRMPRVMYGNAHIYNNYYNAPGNSYCIGVGSYGSALIENNYFKDVNNPIEFMYNVYAFILQRNNKFDNTKGKQDGTTSGKIYGERYITTDPYTLLKDPDKLTSVPYEYKLDKAEDVPSIVMKAAGPH